MPETLETPQFVEYVDGRRHLCWVIEDEFMDPQAVYILAVPTFFKLTLLEAGTTSGKTVKPVLRVSIDITAPDNDVIINTATAAQYQRFPNATWPYPLQVIAPTNRLYLSPVISATGHAELRLTLIEGHQ